MICADDHIIVAKEQQREVQLECMLTTLNTEGTQPVAFSRKRMLDSLQLPVELLFDKR